MGSSEGVNELKREDRNDITRDKKLEGSKPTTAGGNIVGSVTDPITGRSSGGSSGGSRKRGRQSSSEAELLELAVLNDDEIQKTTKKKYKKKSVSEDNIKSLLGGIFTIIGTKSPIWIVQDSELDMIAQPAGRLFDKYISEKSEDASDIIALSVAIIIMIIPRLILSIALRKEGKQSNDTQQERKAETSVNTTNNSVTGSIPGISELLSYTANS